jgi:hypothetical protein
VRLLREGTGKETIGSEQTRDVGFDGSRRFHFISSMLKSLLSLSSSSLIKMIDFI